MAGVGEPIHCLPIRLLTGPVADVNVTGTRGPLGQGRCATVLQILAEEGLKSLHGEVTGNPPKMK